jgi:hypothetical protein
LHSELVVQSIYAEELSGKYPLSSSIAFHKYVDADKHDIYACCYSIEDTSSIHPFETELN